MAIDYYCALATGSGAGEVVGRLHALIGGTLDRTGAVTVIVTNAMVARIRSVSDPQERQDSLEEWGVETRVSISFRVERDLTEDYYFKALRDLAVASVRLADDLDADAILTINLERALMRRTDGQVSLYGWWSDWSDPDALAELPAGYVIVNDGRDQPNAI